MLFFIGRMVGQIVAAARAPSHVHAPSHTQHKQIAKEVISSHLLHNTSFPLGKRRVPPQFVLDVLHFDLDTALGLFTVARRRFLRLQRTVSVLGYVVYAAMGLQAHALRRHAPFVVADVRF